MLIQKTRLLRTVSPLRGVALHKDQPIATVRPSNFHQQGHIKYNRLDVCTLSILGNELLGSLQYAWVNHFVQSAQLLGVGKDHLPQLGAVDPPGRVQNLSTKLPHQLVANRLLLQQVMGDRVGTDDGAAQFSELCCDGAFAGRNTANNPDNWLFPGIAHNEAVGLLTPM